MIEFIYQMDRERVAAPKFRSGTMDQVHQLISGKKPAGSHP